MMVEPLSPSVSPTSAPTRTRTPAHNAKSKDLPPLLQHRHTSQPSIKFRSSCTKITLHSCGGQVRLGDWGGKAMSDSSAVTFDSSADIVLCAAACCACNEEDSSTARTFDSHSSRSEAHSSHTEVHWPLTVFFH
jgi:hypothetical protein